MNQEHRSSLTALLNQSKNVYQRISHQIIWSEAEASRLDDLMHAKDLVESLRSKVLRETKSWALAEWVPSFLSFKAWQRTKVIYSFNPDFVDIMSQTADTNIYISLLERLPFKDMLFFFPEKGLFAVNGEEVIGIYVHVESHHDTLWININSINRNPQDNSQFFPGIGIGFPIVDRMKMSEVFETPQFMEWLSAFKKSLLQFNRLDEQFTDELIASEKRALNTAINLLYYLSAKNADIKAVKRQKKPHKPIPRTQDDSMPTIQHFEVGTGYSEIIYRHLNEAVDADEDEDIKNDEDTPILSKRPGKKKRPHARRAHWNYYWTGEGRSRLESRWISDIFVGANRADQAVIVYDTAKESAKGKRNPNTSKKKRNSK